MMFYKYISSNDILHKNISVRAMFFVHIASTIIYHQLLTFNFQTLSIHYSILVWDWILFEKYRGLWSAQKPLFILIGWDILDITDRMREWERNESLIILK
jgi:hypothetical protein